MVNCQVCGLPEEICMCKQQKVEGAKLKVYTEKRRYGKEVTIIGGVPADSIYDVASELKTKCAAGGTVKEGKIEVQGSHMPKIKVILQGMGYSIS